MAADVGDVTAVGGLDIRPRKFHALFDGGKRQDEVAVADFDQKAFDDGQGEGEAFSVAIAIVITSATPMVMAIDPWKGKTAQRRPGEARPNTIITKRIRTTIAPA